jgi:NAD(P)-dependent dehydrogenase (short-subunit alcohol dehydrogenase family)
MRVCIVGASGKLGRYMVQHALDRGYQVVGVCREKSVGKLAEFEGRITVVPGATDDREVIKRAVAGCDGVLVVLVPRGVHGYSSGTAQAVLDHAEPGARLVFSVGWHITRDGQDVYSWRLKALVNVAGRLARLARVVDLDDQVEACRRIFASDTRWTVVRGSDLEEGESQGLPCGAGTWATPSSRATSRAAWISPYSWWRPSKTTISFTRLPRSSAARVLPRSRTRLPERPSASHPRLAPSCEHMNDWPRVTVAPTCRHRQEFR